MFTVPKHFLISLQRPIKSIVTVSDRNTYDTIFLQVPNNIESLRNVPGRQTSRSIVINAKTNLVKLGQLGEFWAKGALIHKL